MVAAAPQVDLTAGRPAVAAMVALGRPDDVVGAARLAVHLTLLAGTGCLVWLALGSGWLLPAMALHGVVLVALFAPLHEAVHRTAFRSRRLNDAVAALLGFATVLPARHYRHFHMAHHRYTQQPGLDPELPEVKPLTLGAYLLAASGFNYWRRNLRQMARLAVGRPAAGFVPERERAAVAAEARWYFAGYAALAMLLAAGVDAILWLWLLPLLLGQPWLRLYLMAEHVGCPPDADQLAATRTTLTVWPVRALMWNMPFHAEHHAWPGVPFHALPAAHRRAAASLRETEAGYLAFHRRYLGEIVAGRAHGFVLGGVDPAAGAR